MASTIQNYDNPAEHNLIKVILVKNSDAFDGIYL